MNYRALLTAYMQALNLKTQMNAALALQLAACSSSADRTLSQISSETQRARQDSVPGTSLIIQDNERRVKLGNHFNVGVQACVSSLCARMRLQHEQKVVLYES